MNSNWDHLIPEAAKLLQDTDEQRLTTIQSDLWITYPQVKRIFTYLEYVLHHPRVVRVPSLLIIGEQNSGKSSLLTRFAKHHPPIEAADGTLQQPVLSILAPYVASEQEFFDTIMLGLGIPPPRQESLANRKARTYIYLQKARVRLLAIDELHTVLAGSTQRHRNFLELLRDLTNRLRISLVGAGIESAFTALHYDAQLSSRFHTEVLPKWGMGPEYKRLLASYERLLPLKQVSNLTGEALSEQLLTMSQGSMGELAAILKLAAMDAVMTGSERITLAGLDRIAYGPPSDREILPHAIQ